jgi:hypothetical protein
MDGEHVCVRARALPRHSTRYGSLRSVHRTRPIAVAQGVHSVAQRPVTLRHLLGVSRLK